ncbi:MAG TPA: AmmeMemoRadiSam system radical SAM enzyme [Clostridiales bacterium]|nr:AmmeMemoRadiSam system radical SAM enzyme [Clostridiales bacterium]
MKGALFYQPFKNQQVQCCLCPHGCRISDGEFGQCGVRKNEKGKLYSLNYGVITAYHLDPIEKKPLYHFYPGSRIFSIGSAGCNLKCRFCQNWEIAHGQPSGIRMTAEEIVAIAKTQTQNIGIAYTYNEPSIWYEFVYETAVLAHQEGLKNVLVTNGFIQKEPLKQLLPYIDAMNIDLKAFQDSFYREICGGRMEPVKETIRIAAEQCHVEITTLLIGDLNGSAEEVERLSRWIAEIRPNIPLHLTRYFPAYQMTAPPTPAHVLTAAQKEAKKHLQYVYIGNVHEVDRNTYCPGCGSKIINRSCTVEISGLDREGKCIRCGQMLPIVR